MAINIEDLAKILKVIKNIKDCILSFKAKNIGLK